MIYFTPLFTVLFTFPSRYWFTIVLSGVFSLNGWSRQIHTGFHVPRTTQDTTIYAVLTHTGLSPSMAPLSKGFWFILLRMMWSYNPDIAVTMPVWANPRSLATTYGITFVFFSSGYLDVSVLRVCPRQWRVPYLQYGGLPHSDICGSICMCQSPQLFAAYHVLHRL